MGLIEATRNDSVDRRQICPSRAKSERLLSGPGPSHGMGMLSCFHFNGSIMQSTRGEIFQLD